MRTRDPLHEYDRWHRNYRRRQAVMAAAGYLVGGAIIATIVWAFLWLLAAVAS